MGVDGREAIIADATTQPLSKEPLCAIASSNSSDEAEKALSRTPAITTGDSISISIEPPTAANAIDDAARAREDAMRRAAALGLSGSAADLKAEIEMAFARVPEGQDVTVIMLSTVIAERVGACTDRRAAIEVANRAIHERSKIKDPIRRNADALKAAVYEVLTRFFRN